MHLDIDIPLAFDLVPDDRLGLIQWNKKSLAHQVIRPDIGADHRIRTVLDSPEQPPGIRIAGRALLPEAHAIPAQDLKGIGPHFKALGRVAHDHRAPSMYRYKTCVRGDIKRGRWSSLPVCHSRTQRQNKKGAQRSPGKDSPYACSEYMRHSLR